VIVGNKKHNIMKKLILITILSTLLFGCPSNDDYNDRYYTIENQSNHTILIKFYKEGNLLDYITTTLSENGEQYSGHFTYDNIIDSFRLPQRAYEESDSIIFDFDNVKRQIYTIDFINQTLSEPIDSNIFRHENYDNVGNDRFLFKITEEDYINADDI
jgi:hypothetical protein